MCFAAALPLVAKPGLQCCQIALSMPLFAAADNGDNPHARVLLDNDVQKGGMQAAVHMLLDLRRRGAAAGNRHAECRSIEESARLAGAGRHLHYTQARTYLNSEVWMGQFAVQKQGQLGLIGAAILG